MRSGGMVQRVASSPWLIGVMLCLGTTINYINRLSFSLQAPIVASEYGFTNTELGALAFAFRFPYALLQLVWGRAMDSIGARLGLAVGALIYAAASVCMGLTRTATGFAILRGISALGQAASWPGSSKAVSAHFQEGQRGIAVALFDSGAAIGGALCPIILLVLLRVTKHWRPVFIVVGILAVLWTMLWTIAHRVRRFALQSRPTERGAAAPHSPERSGALALLRNRATWGIILAFFLLDPYLSFLTDWLAVYLVNRGVTAVESIRDSTLAFVALGLGNLVGGALPSVLIKRGWGVLRARQTVFVAFALTIISLAAVNKISSSMLIVGLIAYATFAYAVCSTIMLTMPIDIASSDSVGTLSGLGASAGAVGTLIASYLIGYVSDRISFGPVVAIVALLPAASALVCVSIVRPGEPNAAAQA